MPLTLVIDGNNLAHRMKHAMHMSNKGVDVSVTYGFIKNIVGLYNKFKPNSIVVCWDGGVPEFRRKAVPEYKAQRDHGDPLEYEDFLRQMRELSDYAFPMMGVITIRKIGAEADDLMAQAAKMIKGQIIIVSTDKDMLQCINPNTRVYSPTADMLYDEAKFEAKMGIPLHDYIDWRALQGDSSDNIPGIYGIGEKTATKLFNEYHTLTGITNAAMGHNPAGRLDGPIGTNIVAFGFDRICKNIFIMALYADRVGARMAIIKGINSYHKANKERIRKYFMKNAFVSLVGSVGVFDRLIQPQLIDECMQTPIICSRRMPV